MNKKNHIFAILTLAFVVFSFSIFTTEKAFAQNDPYSGACAGSSQCDLGTSDGGGYGGNGGGNVFYNCPGTNIPTPWLGFCASMCTDTSATNYTGTGPCYYTCPDGSDVNSLSDCPAPSEPCTSSPNACGQTSSGMTQSDGSCSAATPANPSGYGTSCSSPANSCGVSGSGTIQCDGSCSAATPSNPSNLGASCTSSANACGQTGSGSIQCNGSCSATTPSAPSNLGASCSGPANKCGQTNSGTIGCDGSCSATVAPSDSSCAETPCTSSPNACGQTGSGFIDGGACNASTPALPPSYGQSCVSSANSCGMTNTGTYGCGGSCSASAPSDSLCPPPPPTCATDVGQSCSSSANSCGMTNSGVYDCYGSCSAVSAPSDSLCPVTPSQQCLDPNAENYTDYASCVYGPSEPTAPTTTGGGGGDNGGGNNGGGSYTPPSNSGFTLDGPDYAPIQFVATEGATAGTIDLSVNPTGSFTNPINVSVESTSCQNISGYSFNNSAYTMNPEATMDYDGSNYYRVSTPAPSGAISLSVSVQFSQSIMTACDVTFLASGGGSSATHTLEIDPNTFNPNFKEI